MEVFLRYEFGRLIFFFGGGLVFGGAYIRTRSYVPTVVT